MRKDVEAALIAYNAVWDAAQNIDAHSVEAVRYNAMCAALDAVSILHAGEQEVDPFNNLVLTLKEKLRDRLADMTDHEGE